MSVQLKLKVVQNDGSQGPSNRRTSNPTAFTFPRHARRPDSKQRDGLRHVSADLEALFGRADEIRLDEKSENTVVAQLERLLGRQISEGERSAVIQAARQIHIDACWLVSVLREESALIPRFRSPMYDSEIEFETCEPSFIGFRASEVPHHDRERRIYELTRELMEVTEDLAA